MAIKNQVQLISYPDSLGGNLKTLSAVLSKYFPEIFKGGIHILPPYPSSGDRGFAPLTHLEINPLFGSWKDILAISSNYDTVLDLVVNHISSQSVYFQDFIKNGRESKYADLFITIDKIWPDGIPSEDDLSKIFLRRKKPYSSFTIKKTGKQEKVWTTFGKNNPSEQIDIDINAPITKKLIENFLENFNKYNIKIIRLDAVAYVIKKMGTSCFFVEPEINDFLQWISQKAKSLKLELLPEIHAHYSIQFKLAKKGYWIYDFILPYVILETFITKSTKRLKEYLKIRPHNQFTMLDCHDGIPVKPDLDDFVSSAEAQKVIDVCLDRGANLSLVYSEKYKNEDGFDVHQIRTSYFSALNSDDDAYIAARAIQFFTPGIPQVYYVGLLAGENDTENVNLTGEGREINRHNFNLKEIHDAVQKPVVKRLLKLIQFRNDFPAFNGTFSIDETNTDKISLTWQKKQKFCTLTVDLNTNSTIIKYVDDNKSPAYYKV